MSKHTPGPWIGAGPSFGDPLPRYTTEIVTEREDEDGAATSICELPFHHHDDENEANARLIAAAPELLELLREAAGYTRHPDYDWPVEFSRRVDAAFAKATGEQQ